MSIAQETAALYRDLVDRAAAEDDVPDHGEGRGIVIAAGGARMFTCAWVAIRMLREQLGVTLPIEVWHLGAREMSPAMAALLADLGVEVVDALTLAEAKEARMLGGWELKPFAVRHCRFREVLLIDADNVAIEDPTPLFDSEPYRNSGAVFWPDIVSLGRDNGIWDICGVSYREMPSFESGQLLVDKARCSRALQLTWVLNNHSDFFYRLVYGDKDTFMMGWMRTATPFALVPHPARTLSGAVCQHDFEGRRIFQHRSLHKWLLRGANPRIEGFRHEDTCLGYLLDLHALWNGRVFAPPAPKPSAAAVAAELLACRHFEYELVSDRLRPLELLPGGRIGAGRTDDECYWWMESAADGITELAIGEDLRNAVRLRRTPAGEWRGRWRTGNQTDVIMIPAAGSAAADRPSGHNGATVGKMWAEGLWVYKPLGSGE
jgi:hypothetical protein